MPQSRPDFSTGRPKPSEPGWTVRHPRYGVWFLSRAAVAADWKQDRKQALPNEAEREPLADEIETWWNEQTSWIEVRARGVQLERPDMAAIEQAFLREMSGNSDLVAHDGADDPTDTDD